MSSHRMTMFAMGLAAYACVFVMAHFTFLRNWIGAQVDLLPGLIVVAALMHGIPAVLAVSITGGLFYDSVSANPFGVTCLSLLLVGAFVHHNRDLLLKDQAYPQFVLGAGASAAAPVLSYVGLTILGKHPILEWSSLWIWFVMTVGGGLVTPLWFAIFRRLDTSLHYQVIPESSFRADREIERGRT